MPLRMLLFLAAVCLTADSITWAQGLHVVTQIYDANVGRTDGQPRLLSSSLSLFHNGRVYDYVENADEVVIYDPTARRFTILNQSRSLVTTVDFDEIGHLMGTREPNAEKYITELQQAGDPDAARTARRLRFQLHPEFESRFDARSQTLQMLSPSWKYSVSVRPWDDEEQRQRYLTYCDWTARLNSVLHPSSNFPEPRMALNARLREIEGQMPVVVELDLRPDDDRILRAEHRFQQNLDDTDRRLIRRWDTAANSGRLKTLSFRRYQEAVLVSVNR
ncbi:MAG: hypothetical protein R3C19_09060 [Planctomycetaceae bacterium]